MSENVLAADTRPRFFVPTNGIDAPPSRHGLSVRAAVRSLAGMQKEALVRNGVTGITWRFVSDEGPYLDGFDEGPCPLSFLTTGMVSMFADAIVDAARARSLDPAGMVLTLDNRYTMDGSARANGNPFFQKGLPHRRGIRTPRHGGTGRKNSGRYQPKL